MSGNRYPTLGDYCRLRAALGTLLRASTAEESMQFARGARQAWAETPEYPARLSDGQLPIADKLANTQDLAEPGVEVVLEREEHC